MNNKLKITRGDSENQENYAYVIYTVANGNQDCCGAPVGITDGFVASDKYELCINGTLNLSNPLIEEQWNTKRRSRFPIETCHKALALMLEKANATLSSDKSLVLNSNIGKADSLTSVVLKSHSANDQLNAMLRGEFAASLYRTSLVEIGDAQMDVFRQAPFHPPSPDLVISFAKCAVSETVAKYFVNSLPFGLVRLDLDTSNVGFDTLAEFAVGLGQLQQLKCLKLTFHPCAALTDA